MRKGLVLSAVCFVLAGIMTLSASPARAQVQEGSWELEFFGGSYFPGPDVIDDQFNFGFRLGRNFTQNLGFVTELGYVNSDGEADLPMGHAKVDYDATILDLSVVGNFNADSRFVPIVFGGLGWAFANADVTFTGPTGDEQYQGLDDSAFTLHGGAGVKIYISESVYIRIAGRARWFESREDDAVDAQVTAGVGFMFATY